MKTILWILIVFVLLLVIVSCPMSKSTSDSTTTSTITTTTTTVPPAPFGATTMYVRGNQFDSFWSAIDGTNDMTWNGATNSYELTVTNLTSGTYGAFKFSDADWIDSHTFGGQSFTGDPDTTITAGTPVYLGWQGHPYWADISDVNRSDLEAVIPTDGDYEYALDLTDFIEYTNISDPTDDTGAAWGSVTKL